MSAERCGSCAIERSFDGQEKKKASFSRSLESTTSERSDSLAVIGTVFCGIALARFRRTIGSMAYSGSAEETLAYLKFPIPVYLLVRDKDWQSLKARAGPSVSIVARRRDLYKNCEILVVRNQA